jgi:hypothetical protein
MVKCGFFLLSRGLPSQRSTWESVMTAGPVRFPGSRPAAFAFFRELRDNNDPAWFKPRKGLYEAEVLAPFGQLIAAVSEALAAAGLPLVGDPARGCDSTENYTPLFALVTKLWCGRDRGGHPL